MGNAILNELMNLLISLARDVVVPPLAPTNDWLKVLGAPWKRHQMRQLRRAGPRTPTPFAHQ